MSRLEIRLFGGLEVRAADRTVHAFESRKVRGLLAYLVIHRRHLVSRRRLASLLWSEKSDESARRNLRQALHNLRSALAPHLEPQELLLVQGQELQLNPEIDCWLDVEQFEAAVRNGFADTGPDTYQLAIAARLYTGDFLAGFAITDSPSFEDWQLAEQERLREAAIETFRTLIEASIKRGEHRMGILHARRLLAIDPLSETVHRRLMQLYALSGHRSRALAQYEKLRSLLSSELAVEPMADTLELYQSILVADAVEAAEREDEPGTPLIPLVGRGEAFAALQARWESVLEGHGRLTLIEGESGVGKSRLARSFVDAATSRRLAVVLRGNAIAHGPAVGFQPFAELLANALLELVPDDDTRILRELPASARRDLATLCPDLRELAPGSFPASAVPPADPAVLADSLIEFLTLLARSSGEAAGPVPVILLLDDLQWADQASLDLLCSLAENAPGRSLWLLACHRSEEPHPGWLSTLDGDVHDRLTLERLEDRHIDEIAAALVGGASATELATFLMSRSGGLPLKVTELVNFLWDEGALEPREAGLWTLAGDLGDLTPPRELRRIVQLRMRRLPTSTRRLLALASVLGQRFDTTLLQRVDGEHMRVVEICLETALERWLIRHCHTSWTPNRPESDLVQWARGARRGTFEFAHQAIREAILRDINPIRKRTLHAAVAARLQEARCDDLEKVSEELAFHFLEAAAWREALPHLEAAAARAIRAGAGGVAHFYLERSLAAVTRLLSDAGDEAERSDLERRQRELEISLQGGPTVPSA